MTAPIIGVTISQGENSKHDPIVSLTQAYVTAVLRAGGIPVLIPVGLQPDRIETLWPHLQGLLLSGGDDINLERYGGTPHPKVHEADPARDAQEIALLNQAVREKLPFLGICRGFQVLNVGLGGTLFSDVADLRPSDIRHDNLPGEPRDRIAHEADVEAGSRLAEITGSRRLEVNSLHHQGVDRIAPGLSISARATDGLVEGLELPGHPFGLAVQWHPEWMPQYDRMQAIFRAFIAAAQG